MTNIAIILSMNEGDHDTAIDHATAILDNAEGSFDSGESFTVLGPVENDNNAFMGGNMVSPDNFRDALMALAERAMQGGLTYQEAKEAIMDAYDRASGVDPQRKVGA